MGDQNAIDQADWRVFNATGIGHLISMTKLICNDLNIESNQSVRSCKFGVNLGSPSDSEL
jgi:hypothetical protein